MEWWQLTPGLRLHSSSLKLNFLRCPGVPSKILASLRLISSGVNPERREAERSSIVGEKYEGSLIIVARRSEERVPRGVYQTNRWARESVGSASIRCVAKRWLTMAGGFRLAGVITADLLLSLTGVPSRSRTLSSGVTKLGSSLPVSFGEH